MKNKPLKIAIVAKYINRYANYGMDMRVAWLTKGLDELGQNIKLHVWPNSEFKSKQVKIFDNKKPLSDNFKNLAIVERIIKEQNNFDIIFTQSNSILPFVDLIKKPIFHTISFTDLKNERINLYNKYNKVNYIAQSNFLKNKFDFNWSGIIHNGIDASSFKFKKNINRKYFLYLGRIHPDKGVDIAAKYCYQNNIPLLIAGMCFDQKYFNESIKPFLGKKVKYIGEVDFQAKIKLYQEARALLCPLRYNETFSNAMIEAMSCGTPVIAFNKGSVSEIIDHGHDGFVVKNITGLDKAIKKINTINNENCRQKVLNNFTYQKMATKYLELFNKKVK